MTIKFKGEEKELRFSFNSFKFMQDFNIKDLEKADEYPLRIAQAIETLLMGSLNANPKERVSLDSVQMFMEEFAKEGDMSELLTDLMDLLSESSFFKSLQKGQMK